MKDAANLEDLHTVIKISIPLSYAGMLCPNPGQIGAYVWFPGM